MSGVEVTLNGITFKTERGWVGAFTRHHADGFLSNGTAIRKMNSKPGDGVPDGTLGWVLGSFTAADAGGYFVEWSTRPRQAVFVVPSRIEAA